MSMALRLQTPAWLHALPRAQRLAPAAHPCLAGPRAVVEAAGRSKQPHLPRQPPPLRDPLLQPGLRSGGQPA